jgi:hypothetical protein
MLPKLIASSEDPTKLALTVKGIMLGMAPLALVLFNITDLEWQTIVESIVTLVTLALTALSTILTLYGLVRKIVLQRWSHPDA